jgi:hypothetical protein
VIARPYVRAGFEHDRRQRNRLRETLKVEPRVRTPLGLRGKTAGHRSNSDSDKPDANGLGLPDSARSRTALHLTAGPRERPLESDRISKAVVRASHDVLRKSKIALPVIRAPTTKIKVAR